MAQTSGLGLSLNLLVITLLYFTPTHGTSAGDYEPMVALGCPGQRQTRTKVQLQNKFLDTTGKWETDYGSKATCKTKTIQILEYCKQVYPERKISTVLQSTKYEKIEHWCKTGSLKCKGPARWVKPWRCIESVSETTPKPTEKSIKIKLETEDEEYKYDDDDYLEEEDDDYYDDEDDEDDEYYDDDDDEYDDDDDLLNEIKTDEKKDEKQDDLGRLDPYYTHYTPADEHAEFQAAIERVEEKHRTKMTKVMREWTTIEEKYESLAKTDKDHAEKLKQEMSKQFESRIELLEKDQEAERDQLVAMHQQRIVSRINEVKDAAMKCYTNSLNAHPVLLPVVRKCLEKLLRSLHKDRHHTLAHFKDLVENSPDQAGHQKEATLQHLSDIDRIMNESLSLLDRFPDLRIKLLPLMEDYLIELRSRDDTPSPMFTMDRVHEEKVLNGFYRTVQNKIQDQEKERMKEKLERKEQYKKMVAAEAAVEKEMVRGKRIDLPVLPRGSDDIEILSSVEEEERILDSHNQAHTFHLDAPEYSVSVVSEPISMMSWGLGAAALTILLAAGVLAHRRKHTVLRSHQGFVEVPTYSTPEEKHLSGLQASGYENPTYKYFEVTTA